MQNPRRELRAAVRLALVPRIRSEDGDSGSRSVCFFDHIRHEIGFVRMMEGSDGEFELVRKADYRGEVDGFVNVNELTNMRPSSPS